MRGAITARRFAAAQGGHVAILVAALGFIALLMAVVGLLGLASALSVATAERTREFGVMRALGASRGLALRVVLAEGAVIAVASWALAVVLSLPLSAVVGRVLASIAAQDLAPRLERGGRRAAPGRAARGRRRRQPRAGPARRALDGAAVAGARLNPISPPRKFP